MKRKYTGHVGLDFVNGFGDLFSFQLLRSDGKAVALVDFDRGDVTGCHCIPELQARQSGIIRLAKRYYSKARI